MPTSLRPLLRALFSAALGGAFWLALMPIEPVIKLFSWQDKVEHALLFAGLAILGVAAWPQRVGLLAAGLLAYGAAMEVAQSTTAYRVGDPLDWLADAVGLLVLLPFLRNRKTNTANAR